MINLILSYLFFFVAGFCGALLGCWLFSKRKWRLVLDEEHQTLELLQDEPGEAEFLADATEEELEDMRATGIRKLLLKFKVKNDHRTN